MSNYENFERDKIAFDIEVDGKTVPCTITHEELTRLFGVRDSDMFEEEFHNHRAEIEMRAKSQLIDQAEE